MITSDSTQIQSITAQSDPISSAFSGPDLVFKVNESDDFRFIDFSKYNTGKSYFGSITEKLNIYCSSLRKISNTSQNYSGYIDISDSNKIEGLQYNSIQFYTGVCTLYSHNSSNDQTIGLRIESDKITYLAINIKGSFFTGFDKEKYTSWKTNLTIKSNSLEVIDLPKLTELAQRVTIDCPNLKHFRLKSREVYEAALQNADNILPPLSVCTFIE